MVIITFPDRATERKALGFLWMKDFKQRWKMKLEQLELWMVSYLITIE